MPRYTDKQIADALIAARGMVFLASQVLDCSHLTIQRRIAKSTILQELREAQMGIDLDTAETRLMDAVEKGDPWALQFLLKTKGKDRGYVERQEVGGIGGSPLITQILIVRTKTDEPLDS